MRKKLTLSLFTSLLVMGCVSQPQLQVSEAEALARLNRLDNWEEAEYQKANKRNARAVSNLS